VWKISHYYSLSKNRHTTEQPVSGRELLSDTLPPTQNLMNTYNKGDPNKISEHFSPKDFDCHCTNPKCKITLVDQELLWALEKLWKITGEFQINSGYRCKEHNLKVGGAQNSYHVLGQAADIQSKRGYNGRAMANYSDGVPGLTGVGIAFSWIHVDTRPNKARWIYPPKSEFIKV
jgi:zinc D-Ala-D-Ala carboxypeptidase